MAFEKIYKGKIKKCIDYKNFIKDGEETFYNEMESKTGNISIVKQNVRTIDDKAILRRILKDLYIYKRKSSLVFLTNFPKKNGDIFVDEGSLKKLVRKSKTKRLKNN